MEPLHFGIIGCGRVVRESHLPAWVGVPGVRLVAICDDRPQALESIRMEQPGVTCIEGYSRWFQEAPKVDFVVVATPGSTHAQICERFISEGQHVLCEKPVAVSAVEARCLYDAAAKRGVFLTALHNYRFKDSAQAALRLKTTGALGDISSVSVRFRSGSLFDEPGIWLRNESRERSLLFDLAIHFVDLALLIAGPIRTLRFVDALVDSLGLQHVVFGTTHERGVRCNFDLMLDASCKRTEIEVLGETGAVEISFFPDGFRVLPSRDNPKARIVADACRTSAYLTWKLRSAVGRPSRRGLGHHRIFGLFVKAITERGTNPVPAAGVLQTINLLDAVACEAYGLAIPTSYDGAHLVGQS